MVRKVSCHGWTHDFLLLLTFPYLHIHSTPDYNFIRQNFNNSAAYGPFCISCKCDCVQSTIRHKKVLFPFIIDFHIECDRYTVNKLFLTKLPRNDITKIIISARTAGFNYNAYHDDHIWCHIWWSLILKSSIPCNLIYRTLWSWRSIVIVCRASVSYSPLYMGFGSFTTWSQPCHMVVSPWSTNTSWCRGDQHSVPLIARFVGPTWGPSGADRTQVGPILAPWTLLSGSVPQLILHINLSCCSYKTRASTTASYAKHICFIFFFCIIHDCATNTVAE